MLSNNEIKKEDPENKCENVNHGLSTTSNFTVYVKTEDVSSMVKVNGDNFEVDFDARFPSAQTESFQNVSYLKVRFVR